MVSSLKKSGSINKRAKKRLPTSFFVKFLFEDSMNYGLVKNISEKGMCISTGVQLPSDIEIALLIPLKNEEVALPVRVRWSTNSFDFYDSMGVEILKPSREYLQLFKNIKNI